MTEHPRITIEITPGELADRYTIAKLKTERITEADKAQFAAREAAYLEALRLRQLGFMSSLQRENYFKFETELANVNTKIWGYEDKIRDKRAVKKDPTGALYTAQQIHEQNDERYRLKVKINTMLNIATLEQKSYNYGPTE